MRLQLLSDLHFEFHHDNGRSFVESLDPEGVDVLVLAGDVAVGEDLPDALGLLCRKFHDASVVYVHGNHEFYHSDLERIRQLTRQSCGENSNLSWLDKSGVMVRGAWFWGAPLWFPHTVTDPSLKRLLNDFAEIGGFESWVYRENMDAVGFLKNSVRPGDIVVTRTGKSCRARNAMCRDAFFFCECLTPRSTCTILTTATPWKNSKQEEFPMPTCTAWVVVDAQIPNEKLFEKLVERLPRLYDDESEALQHCKTCNPFGDVVFTPRKIGIAIETIP